MFLFPNGGPVGDPPVCLNNLIPESLASGLSTLFLGEPCESGGTIFLACSSSLFSAFSALIFLFRYFHILVWLWGLVCLILILFGPPPLTWRILSCLFSHSVHFPCSSFPSLYFLFYRSHILDLVVFLCVILRPRRLPCLVE